jgi:outer membrane biosynthesis protein TonB
LLNNPPPLYPSAAHTRGQEERVLLSVTVSVARVNVRKWKFKPAVKNGAAMKEMIDQPVVFSLKK